MIPSRLMGKHPLMIRFPFPFRYYYKHKVFEIVPNKRLVYKFGSRAYNWRKQELERPGAPRVPCPAQVVPPQQLVLQQSLTKSFPRVAVGLHGDVGNAFVCSNLARSMRWLSFPIENWADFAHARFTHQHVGTHSACLKTNRRRMLKSCAPTWHPGYLHIRSWMQTR